MLGEANFSDHGANRLGARALMQGLADGYFVIPYTHRRLPRRAASSAQVDDDHAGVQRGRGATSRGADRAAAVDQRQAHASTRSTASSASIMWDNCGMARTEEGLQQGARADPGAARGVLDATSRCPASGDELNQSLEKAGRVADFLEFGELMCLDALHRDESCGGHFREEYQTRTARPSATTSNFALRRRLGVPGRRRSTPVAPQASR